LKASIAIDRRLDLAAGPQTEQAQARRADGLAVGNEPTVGVDGQRPTDLGGPVSEELLLLTAGAETVIGHVDHLGEVCWRARSARRGAAQRDRGRARVGRAEHVLRQREVEHP
jgi:hypothetical protein